MAKGVGRRKGSHNKGYFYRTGRGWYMNQGGSYTPLLGADSEHLRNQNTEPRV